MRTYQGPEGDQRIWYNKGEIEAITNDELRRAGLYPTAEAPVVDLERLLERHLKSRLDVNANLPLEVLGQTDFEKDGATKVLVNKDLTGEMEDLGERGTIGRWRATLAHEAGHVLLHRHLFFLDSRQGSFFDTDTPVRSQTLLRCLKRNVSLQRSTGSDWREVQANEAMASLLMPRQLFHELASETRRKLSIGDKPVATGSREAAALADELASTFGVSRTAAMIRLKTLGLTVDGAFAGLAL